MPQKKRRGSSSSLQWSHTTKSLSSGPYHERGSEHNVSFVAVADSAWSSRWASSDVKQDHPLRHADGILSKESTFVPSARRQCPGQHSAWRHSSFVIDTFTYFSFTELAELPSTSVPRSVLPERERKKKSLFKHLFVWRLAKVEERESTGGNPWCSALVADTTKIYFALFSPPLLQICSLCLFLSNWGEAVKSFSCTGRGCLIWQQFKTALLVSKSQSACQPGEFEKAMLHSAHVWERERERDGAKLRATAQPFPPCLTWQSSFFQDGGI